MKTFSNSIHFLLAFVTTIMLNSCIKQITNKSKTDIWVTKADKSMLFEKQASISISETPDVSIEIDENEKYQEMDGFGFALTQGSAEALLNLNETTRKELLEELFRENQSIVRISIGASDLSNSVYSYNEQAGDDEMEYFTFDGPDVRYLFPVLREILAINPKLKIMATPWTAPTWMKTNGTWIGGKLKIDSYSTYATYFATYINKMGEMGFSIWAITPQNEPLNDKNEPSMLMDANEQLEFIDKYLGPKFESVGILTKIIAYDHNCDRPDYPIMVLNDSKYAQGAAFHLYGGDIKAMTEVHEATNKDVYFTEQFVSSKGNFGGDLEWHIKNVIVGSTQNWSRTVIEWNLATNNDLGPRTPGGCEECLGAITVKGEKIFDRNVSYYIMQHVSKFVKPGAFRVSSSTNILPNVVFLNPDGSKVVLAFNSENKDLVIEIIYKRTKRMIMIPAKSAVTIVF